MSRLEVLVPVAVTRTVSHPLAARCATLDHVRIGWLDNMKANAAALLEEVATALRGRGHAFEMVRVSKNATAAAPPGVMAHLETCDAVVLAIAD
ncbi:MAG: hypothetical protein WD928_15475 [Gammaproteobacteria bacterium]